MLLQLLKGRKIKSKFFLFGEGYYIPLSNINIEITSSNNRLNSLIHNGSILMTITSDITINIVVSKMNSIYPLIQTRFDLKTDRGTFLNCQICDIYDQIITIKSDHYLC